MFSTTVPSAESVAGFSATADMNKEERTPLVVAAVVVVDDDDDGQNAVFGTKAVEKVAKKTKRTATGNAIMALFLLILCILNSL
jgi:hypothetical protein